jgi:hypothetical protein
LTSIHLGDRNKYGAESAQLVTGTSKDTRPLKAKFVERLFRC